VLFNFAGDESSEGENHSSGRVENLLEDISRQFDKEVAENCFDK